MWKDLSPGDVGMGTMGGTTLRLKEDSTMAPDQARCFFFARDGGGEGKGEKKKKERKKEKKKEK